MPKYNLPSLETEKKETNQKLTNYAVLPGQFSTMYYDDNAHVNPNTGSVTHAAAANPVYHPSVSTSTTTSRNQTQKAPATTSTSTGSSAVTKDPYADYRGQLEDLYNKVMGYESYKPGSYNPSTFTPETYTPSADYTPGVYTPGSAYTPTTFTANMYSPGFYTATVDTSGTQDMLNTALADIRGYDDFQYDLNGDLLYQQMVDNYTMLGKQAMADTMGQAAALTSGYGNSYAAGVGNQAYQQYLTQVNNQIPAFQQAALNVWQSGYDRLLNDYGAISQQLANLLSIEDMNFNIWNANEQARFNAFSMNEANRFNAWNANEQNAYNSWLANEQNAYNAFNTNEQNAFNAWLANEQKNSDAFNANESNRFNAWQSNEQNAYNSWLANEQLKQDAWVNNYGQLMDQYNTGRDYIDAMVAMQPQTVYVGGGSGNKSSNTTPTTNNAIVNAVLNGNSNLNPNNAIVGGALLSSPLTSDAYLEYLKQLEELNKK